MSDGRRETRAERRAMERQLYAAYRMWQSQHPAYRDREPPAPQRAQPRRNDTLLRLVALVLWMALVCGVYIFLQGAMR